MNKKNWSQQLVINIGNVTTVQVKEINLYQEVISRLNLHSRFRFYLIYPNLHQSALDLSSSSLTCCSYN